MASPSFIRVAPVVALCGALLALSGEACTYDWKVPSDADAGIVGPDSGSSSGGPSNVCRIPQTDCNYSCSGSAGGASCSTDCQGGTQCTSTCSKGGCTMTCRGGAQCDFSCSGGRCVFDCATGSLCKTSCSGGNCDLRCGIGACE